MGEYQREMVPDDFHSERRELPLRLAHADDGTLREWMRLARREL